MVTRISAPAIAEERLREPDIALQSNSITHEWVRILSRLGSLASASMMRHAQAMRLSSGVRPKVANNASAIPRPGLRSASTVTCYWDEADAVSRVDEALRAALQK